MSSGLGERFRGPPARGRGRPSRSPGELARLVTRLVVAQSIATAAVGLPFSRRQVSSIALTLVMVAVMTLLALLARSGARSAWLVAISVELVFFLFGLSRFVAARYVGGTLFALIIVGALCHPAVAGAYGVRLSRAGRMIGEAAGVGEAGTGALAGEAFGEETYGGEAIG